MELKHRNFSNKNFSISLKFLILIPGNIFSKREITRDFFLRFLMASLNSLYSSLYYQEETYRNLFLRSVVTLLF